MICHNISPNRNPRGVKCEYNYSSNSNPRCQTVSSYSVMFFLGGALLPREGRSWHIIWQNLSLILAPDSQVYQLMDLSNPYLLTYYDIIVYI